MPRCISIRRDGKHLFSWGESGNDPGQFNIVHYVGVDRDGWFMWRTGKTIAYRCSARREIRGAVDKHVAGSCLYLDTKGGQELIYVGEYFSGINPNRMGTQLGPRVSIYDTKGNRIARLGTQTYGDEPGRFYSPHGIAVDSKATYMWRRCHTRTMGARWTRRRNCGRCRS